MVAGISVVSSPLDAFVIPTVSVVQGKPYIIPLGYAECKISRVCAQDGDVRGSRPQLLWFREISGRDMKIDVVMRRIGAGWWRR